MAVRVKVYAVTVGLRGDCELADPHPDPNPNPNPDPEP